MDGKVLGSLLLNMVDLAGTEASLIFISYQVEEQTYPYKAPHCAASPSLDY
jgi:hypothetical protein